MNPKVEELLLMAKNLGLQKTTEDESKTIAVVTEQLPSVYETPTLGLNLNTTFTTDHILTSVKVPAYKNLNLTADQTATTRARVGRLTTGASAAVPLACRGSTCPFKATCLDGDTLVMTPGKNEFVKIKNLKKNSQVYSYNAETGTLEKDRVVAILSQGIKEVFKITTETGKILICTEDHPILTTNINNQPIFLKLCTGLTVGSAIYVTDYDTDLIELNDFGDLFEDKIKSISYEGLKDVYDISVNINNTFIANGIAVHNCQPTDEQVLVADKGYKNIQDLDPTTDKVVTMTEKTGVINYTGKEFTLHQRSYSDTIYTISNGINSYKCTKDHICYATFNKTSIKKHLVYLMRVGDKFRVGVTTLMQEMPKNGRRVGPRYAFGLRVRVNMEKADCAWILGIYDTRVEALLDEEYYSIKLKAPKSLFIADDAARHTSWNGKSKRVTQQQLDAQFNKLNGSVEFYANFLKSKNLDIDYPFVTRNGGAVIQIGLPMHVRACNLIDGYMDIVSVDSGVQSTQKLPLKVTSKDFYHGSVYSLDVAEDHNYFTTGGILTKNCPYYEINAHQIGEDCLVEAQLIEFYTAKFIEEFAIDPNSITEVHLISRLVEITIYEIRMTQYLKLNDQDLMADFVTGTDLNGGAITNKGASIALDVQEKLSRQKMKILESLNGTRERKTKILLETKSTERDSSLSDLRNKLDRLAQEINAKVVN
jgi:hypothetical protein